MRIDEIKAITAIPFSAIEALEVYKLSPGLSRIVGENPRMNESGMMNFEAYQEDQMITAQLIASVRDEILKFKAQEVVRIWDSQRVITRSMLTSGSGYTYLPFSNIIPAISRLPVNDTQYFFFRPGPLVNGYDVTVIPNQGLRFTEPWAEGQTGVLYITGVGVENTFQTRTWTADNFEGEGNRTIVLNNLGPDILNRMLTSFPASVDELQVWTSMQLLVGGGQDYTFTIVDGVYTIQLVEGFDLLDDQFIHIWVNKQP